MQPALSIPWRGALAAALVMTAIAVVPPDHRMCSTGQTMVRRLAETTSFPAAMEVGVFHEDWLRADHLARVIEARRYGEIEDAAAAVDPWGPYGRWVRVARGLAVEQLDTTAGAYARLGRCAELAAFLRQVELAWPAGRAAMRPVGCIVSAGGKALGAGSAGGNAGLVARDPSVAAVAAAARAGDHAGALAACGAFGAGITPPPACLAEACRAGDLAAAEVLRPYGDAMARRACARAGVTFSARGIARVATPAAIAPVMGWRASPSDLVRVHPDAPVP